MTEVMTEIQGYSEYEMGVAEATENPLNRSFVVELVEFGAAAAAGFAVSDLASAKLETHFEDKLVDQPALWWIFPGVKVLIGGLLIYAGSKMMDDSPHVGRFAVGFACGIFSDVANDLITVFSVDTKLEITRKSFVVV